MMFAVAAMLVSCGGNNEGNKSGSASGEAKGGAFEFAVANGITGTTGTKNCFLPETGAPIKFEVAGEGEDVDLTAKLTAYHTDKTEVDTPRQTTELWISGRDNDNKDVKVTLTADEESQKNLEEWFKKGKGEKVDLVFKVKAKKADLEKLNGKNTTNTLVL